MPSPSGSPKIPSGYRRLPGSERRGAPDAELIGPAPAADPVHVTVVLRRRPDGPALPGAEHYAATPPAQRRRMPAAEFADRYGAAEDDIARVRDFAERNNLAVADVNPARRTVELSGTVEQFSSAFGVALNQYRRPVPPRRAGDEAGSETYRGREGFIYVPAALTQIVVGVFGLDNRSVSQRNMADPPNTHEVPLTKITQLYDFPANQATGQTIAIFSEGGYLASDISTNFGGHPPVVTDIPVNASNNHSADAETTQDIVISASVAPGADVAVYFNDGSQQGWVKTVGRVVHPNPGDPVSSVLSSSWYILNGDDAALSSGVTDAFVTAVHQAFEDAAIQGVTVCIASGDTGTQSKLTDGHAHVQYPGSDPWVLSCGGTTIGNVAGTSCAEWVWNDTSGATGGGISAIFPLPSYQVQAGVPASLNDGQHRRGVPDVAANASVASGYPITVGGGPFPGNGTSASAPLWAGLIAVLNAALNENVGFVNPVLYALGSSVFRDIVAEPGAADNGWAGVHGYPADPGWDACTGWGSPRGNALLAGLHGFYGPAIAVNLEHDLDFGTVCRQPRYRTVHVYNVGKQDLMILSLQRTYGSADFTVLPGPATPLAIAPGAGIDFTIEYRPAGPGVASTATFQLRSDDPVHPTLDLAARGESGAGKLAVSGSTVFGGVPACQHAERTIWIANTGDCALDVSDVAFKHPAPAWQLVNSPFPAALRPGSALPVVLRYHADERYARVQELVITSDDPDTPVRELDVLAHTVWDEPCHDERARRCCRERRCEPACCRCEHGPDEAGHRDRAGADSAA